MARTASVIVIGGGQNGLAAALRLASAGRKVTVVERRAALGGLCAPAEIHPGFTVPGTLFDDGLVDPHAIARLGLEAHGLRLREAAPIYVAEANGPGFALRRSPEKGEDELRRLHPGDADAYGAYRALLRRISPLLGAVMSSPPPPLSPVGLGERLEIARRGLGVWRLGRANMLELLRVAPMCVADFLNERFSSPLLVEALAAPAVTGTWAGPWSAGTTTNLLLAERGPGRRIDGGPAALVAALERAARAAGVEIRAGAEVEEIVLERGNVAGVRLADGTKLAAGAVLSSCDPKRTILDLLPRGSQPLTLEEEFRRIRMRGTVARIDLALGAPFEIATRTGARFEAIRVGGGHVDALERAFDAVKYRRMSEAPHLEIRIPTVADPSLAPAGGEVVSIAASWCPHELEGGWTEAARSALVERVLGRLGTVDPKLREKIVATSLRTPADLESEFALTGGQLHHGEPALDQLLVMRPAPSAARCATPVPGLFLGGSGSHAGGGVNPMAGLLAAEALLAR